MDIPNFYLANKQIGIIDETKNIEVKSANTAGKRNKKGKKDINNEQLLLSLEDQLKNVND